MKRFNIKMKILLPAILLVFVGLVILTGITILQFDRAAQESQDNYVEEFAYHKMFQVKTMIETPLDEIRGLASVFGDSVKNGNTLDRQQVIHMLENWLEENDKYFAIYTIWEPDAFDGLDSSKGQFAPYLVNDGSEIKTKSVLDYMSDEEYEKLKELNKEYVSHPFELEFEGSKYKIINETTPIIIDDKFYGIVGLDMLTTELDNFVNETVLFESGYISVFGMDSTILSHPRSEIEGDLVTKYFDAEFQKPILDALKNGEYFQMENISAKTGVKSKTVIAPVEMGDSGINWAMFVSVPFRELNATIYTSFVTITIFSILFMVVISFVLIIIISKFIAKPMDNSIDEIQKAAFQVTQASSQLSASSHQLSEGAVEQAASIEETSATMDETSAMVQQNADNAHKANELSKKALKTAEQGSDKMGTMSRSMDELKSSSEEIAKIIKVIDDIAFQTNMLALNAAVEAARAGDAGLGFAVVADEVKNLAQKSAEAAKSTSEIIERNIKLSKDGVEFSYDVNVSLNQIVNQVEQVNQLMGEISVASSEQSKGVTQVSEAISQMEIVVQKNAASASENNASAGEMQNQAVRLDEIVKMLNELVKGVKDKNAQEPREGSVGNKKQDKKNGLHIGSKQTASNDKIIPLDEGDGF